MGALRTNLRETDLAVLWTRYIQLAEAEGAFRIQQDELGIRPVWHQKEHRVRTQLMACFLAYALWKDLARWMRRAGLGHTPRTVLEEFAKIKNGGVVLPARQTDGSCRTIHLRGVTTPDEAEKVLLKRLGLTLPQRVRRIDEIAPM